MKRGLNFLILFALIFVSSIVSAGTITLRPDGNGFYNQWLNVSCDSANEWSCVDETSSNTSDRVYTSSTNYSETFTFSDSGLSVANIDNLTLYYYAQRYSASKRSLVPLLRINNTDYLGSLKSLTSSYTTYSQVYTTNPKTGSSWTVSDIDGLEAGMNSYSSNPGGNVAQVYAVVKYTIPNSCSESDGGNYSFVFGNVSGYFNEVYYSNNDVCIDSGNIQEYYCSGTSKIISNQSCGSDGYVGSNYCMNDDVYRDYTDYSCSSGACLSNTSVLLQQDCILGQYCSSGSCNWNNTCSDSDGGFVPSIFGTVSGLYLGNSYSNNDYCVNNLTLMEYQCIGGIYYNSTTSCAGNGTGICSSGSCI